MRKIVSKAQLLLILIEIEDLSTDCEEYGEILHIV
jgi:hypothetical protein